jgi:hypothetical protein
MAICVGYFEPEPLAGMARTFTVSGCVSSKARWRQFETQWTRALRHEDLIAFNGADFAGQSRGFSTGWTDTSRRHRLIETLTRVTEQHIFRAFSCSLRIDDYEQLNAEYSLSPAGISSYGLCAGVLIANVRRWMAERHPDDLTLFIFEEGDIDHRELRRISRAENTDRGEPAQLWPRLWTDERGRRRYLRPLEACDLFAVEGGSAFVSRLSERSRFHGDIVDRDRLERIYRALESTSRAATA